MNRLVKDEIFRKLDAHLASDGFHRPRRSQEWRKAVSQGDVFTIHLNFGLAIVNPSVWCFSSRLGSLWRESGLQSADDPAELAQFGTMLSHLRGQIYDGEAREIAETIYADVVHLGFPYLERLRDLREVVRLLQSTNATFWPTICRDVRAYSLLITLAESDQTQEAFRLLPGLQADLQGAQIVQPKWTEFVKWFTRKYEQNAA